MRRIATVLFLTVALAACGEKEEAAGQAVKAVPASAAAVKPGAFDKIVVTRIRESISGVSGQVRQRGDAIELCDKWLPIPHEAGWCDREKDEEVRALLLDAARLQEAGYAVASEALAVQAVAKAGDGASIPARALTSAFIDMYAPSKGEATDGADAAFDADLQRYWQVWELVQKDIAGITPENKPLTLLRLKGELYRDELAKRAGSRPGLKPATVEDLKARDNALARIAAFHEAEGR